MRRGIGRPACSASRSSLSMRKGIVFASGGRCPASGRRVDLGQPVRLPFAQDQHADFRSALTAVVSTRAEIAGGSATLRGRRRTFAAVVPTVWLRPGRSGPGHGPSPRVWCQPRTGERRGVEDRPDGRGDLGDGACPAAGRRGDRLRLRGQRGSGEVPVEPGDMQDPVGLRRDGCQAQESA